MHQISKFIRDVILRRKAASLQSLKTTVDESTEETSQTITLSAQQVERVKAQLKAYKVHSK